MLELTQTHSGEFGNCWQTAVACLLDLPAEALPSQHEIEKAAKARKVATERNDPSIPEYYAGHFSYNNALNAYLAKHHGLGYMQEDAWRLAVLQFRDPGLHFALGPTTRNEFYHMVIARYGVPIWDTSPTRAGLSRVESFGWLVTVPDGARWHWLSKEAFERDRVRWENRRSGEDATVSTFCCCPECFVGGDYRSRPLEFPGPCSATAKPRVT